MVDVAALAPEAGGAGGNTRVAERDAVWQDLEDAKAKTLAAHAGPAVPVRRRQTPCAPATGDTFVKAPRFHSKSEVPEAGEMQVEQGIGSITWTTTAAPQEVCVFIEAKMKSNP